MTHRKPEILLCFVLLLLNFRLHAEPEPLPSFPADGFITFRMALALGVRPQDLSYRAYSDSRDIIGRYYTNRESGLITGCYMITPPEDPFEQHMLFEARIENGRFRILHTYRLLHGNYSCCWSNMYDGFRRIGDLFFVRYCTTGSAFCAGHTMFFRRVADLQEVNGVVSEMYSGEEEDMVTVSSRLQRRGDTLFMHYNWRSFVWQDEDRPVPTDSAEFCVPFFFRNGELTTPDSATMRQYGLDW